MATAHSNLPIARRSTWRDDCLELICGIANAGGGRLILDAEVDARGVVKRKTNRLIKTIPDLITQSLGLTCAVELVLDGGQFCLEVVVPPAEEPISYLGVFYYYQDGDNRTLDDAAIDRIFQHDAEYDVKWETRPVVQASMDDLNLSLVARFTGADRDTDLTMEMDEVSAMEESLRHAGLMTGVGTPTNAGILLLHDRPDQFVPGATVRIGFFGSIGGAPIFQDEVTGSLIEQVHTTLDLLYDKYLPEEDPLSSKSGASLRGHGVPPRDAVHEAILNALAHKNYDSGTPVHVRVFDDCMYIDNVGRPPRTWTVTALLGRHTSRPNNPALVGALRHLGVIDGWGNGIGSMRLLCMEAGAAEPIYELHDDETTVCFPIDADSMLTSSVAAVSAPSPTAPQPISPAELPEVQTAARARALQQDVSLTLNDEKVLAMIDIDGRLTAPRIAKNLNISESTVRRSFRRLRELGLIVRVGSDKSGFWQVR